MKKKSLLSILISSIFCYSFMSSKVYSSNTVRGLSRTLLERLYSRSVKVDNKVAGIDWRNNRVFLKSNKEPLSEQELNRLKDRSYVPSNRQPTKLDPDKDIIYYENK